ncbi:MAG TPA: VTT domain-containing protein [Acidimicrobiales bacterium]|nr:VTT domain-containing protein [Acidimicrobiales bacterium]
MSTQVRGGFRRALLGLVALRTVLGIVAIPLAPALYGEHFVVLVLLRPTKEVLLAAGFLIRQGHVSLVPVLAAAVPLALLGVWLVYAVGRAYAKELQDADMPAWSRRLLPPDRINAMCRVLDRRGRLVIVLGRIAAFPSSALAAGAGASEMPPRRFLPADALGAVLSVAEVMAAGYFLGAAYKEAGPWVSVVGFLVLAGLLVLLGRRLQQEESST